MLTAAPGDDPRIAAAIGRLATDTAAMRCLGYRGFAKSTRGEMSPEHLVLKLFSSEAEQQACLLAQEALGLEGLDLDGPGPNKFTEWDRANFGLEPLVSGGTGSFYDGAWPCSTCAPLPAPSWAVPRRSAEHRASERVPALPGVRRP